MRLQNLGRSEKLLVSGNDERLLPHPAELRSVWGRWARYLGTWSTRIIIVTLLSTCLAACKTEPSEVPGIGRHVGYYPSRAPGNITIRFERRFGYGTVLPPTDYSNTITLPRAYVFAVDDYQRAPTLRLKSEPAMKVYSSLPQ